jgi:exosortase A
MSEQSVVLPAAGLAPSWRSSLPPLLLLLLGLLLLYRDTFWGMGLIWLRSETFTHCLFVLPMSLWLIWRQRASLARLPPVPAWWLLAPLLGLAGAWLLGELVAVNAVTQLAATGLLVLAVFLMLGWRVGLAMLFPLGFLFFAVPIGEFLLPQFMEWTADFTVFALRLSGIPVYREGLQFVIPSGHWSVVEACSGIRYLIASLVVGTLFAYLNYRTLWRRWVFVGVSLLVPVLANWVRAYLIVMLGHLSDNALATGADHLIYGWVFFGVVMLLMFMIGARWREDDAPPAAEPGLSPPRPAGGVGAAVRPGPVSWALALAALALASLPQVWLWQADRNRPADEPVTALVAPATLNAGWRLMDAAPVVFEPAFQNPSAVLRAWYAADAGAVGLHVSYYRKQHAERKLVSSQNVLVTSNDARWARLSGAVQRFALPDGGSVAVKSAELRPLGLPGSLGAGPEHNLVVWQLYWVNDRLTSSDVWAKLHGAWARLMGRGDDAAVLVLYARRGQRDDAAALLEQFAAVNLPALQAQLRQVRDTLNAPAR